MDRNLLGNKDASCRRIVRLGVLVFNIASLSGLSCLRASSVNHLEMLRRRNHTLHAQAWGVGQGIHRDMLKTHLGLGRGHEDVIINRCVQLD